MPKGIKNNPTNSKENNLIGIEENKAALDLINGWVVAADNKISIAFAVFSVVFGLFNYFSVKDLNSLKNDNEKIYCIALILLVISLIVFVGSIVLYFLCLLPNLSSKRRKKQYSLFYSEIATFDSPNEYSETCKTVRKEKFNTELCHEVFYNSKICNNKMRLFAAGLITSLISLLFSVSVFIIVLFA